LKIETREVPARTAAALPQAAANSTDKPATAAKPAHKKSVEKPGLAAAHLIKKVAEKPTKKVASEQPRIASNKSVDKKPVVTAKALTKPVHMAKVDPLAPLPAHHSGNSKGIAAER
jgi:hypothetical protein